jgi:hypothetical protein
LCESRLELIRQPRGTTPVTRLKAENRKLRDRLAVTLGDAWQADLTATLPRGLAQTRPAPDADPERRV